ncbi:hypothetical protein ACP4OV_017681 [Aristida adscensionis]
MPRRRSRPDQRPLPDELLHLILGRVSDAPAVARTAVLSRRWRRVWVLASNLRFQGTDLTRHPVPGFVDWVLAQRGDAAMESLKVYIRQRNEGPTSPSTEQLNRWLRYAGRRVAGSLWLGVANKAYDFARRGEAVDLPALGALTKLELFLAWFAADGRSLGDFVSSCCPRLQKLHVSCPGSISREALMQMQQQQHLVLCAEALRELHLEGVWGLSTLDVTAPELRVLRLVKFVHCSPELPDIAGGKLARIDAPRLEEIALEYPYLCRPPAAMDTVRRVGGVALHVHGKYYRGTDGLWLLQNCHGVEHVDVQLCHPADTFGVDEDELVDLTSEGAAPFAAGVRSMVVRADLLVQDPRLVASISSLISRCPRLISLQVRNTCDSARVTITSEANPMCFCDNSDKWEFDEKIALESLEEVKFVNFTGAVPEMHLVRLLFESSNSTKCIALIMPPKECGLDRLVLEKEERVRHELMNIPGADMGRWDFLKKEFNWTCNSVKNLMKGSPTKETADSIQPI